MARQSHYCVLYLLISLLLCVGVSHSTQTMVFTGTDSLKDAGMRGAADSLKNLGGVTTYFLSSTAERGGLLWVNVVAHVSAGSKIDSAKVSLKLASAVNSWCNLVSYQIDEDWVEGTAANAYQYGSCSWKRTGIGTGVCGTTLPDSNWATAGGSFSVPYDTVYIDSTFNISTTRLTIYVTTQIQTLLDGTSYGIGFRTTPESPGYINPICSEETTVPANVPIVTVYFTALADPPTALSVDTTDCERAVLVWTEADSIKGGDTYIVRDGTTIDSVGAGTVTYTDSAAVGSHTWGLMTRNPAGLSDTSTTVTKTIISCYDGLDAPVITLLTATGCHYITIEWTEGADTDSIWVYRDAVLIDSLAAGVLAYTDTLDTLGTYCYILIATNEVDETSGDCVNEITVDVPAQVTGFTAVADGDTVRMSWTAVAGATGYYWYLDDVAMEGVSPAVTTKAYAPGDLVSHSYKVSALNDCGEGTASTAVSVSLGLDENKPERGKLRNPYHNDYRGSFR